jgi:outer membrane protein OmpA-like peptidoglycan-associated protein
MDIRKATLLLLSTSFVVACGSDPKPPPAGPAGASQAPTAVAPPAPNAKPDDDASKGQINISDEIKRACGITDAEAYFDFDSAHVQDNARSVLTKLAKCFTDGPRRPARRRGIQHGPRR